MKQKTWREKLDVDNGLSIVKPMTGKMAARWPGQTIAIPSPREIDGFMRKIPHGKVITTSEIVKAVARKHQADIGCPMTTGIFAWIAAHASEEAAQEGEKDVTPYWRTLKPGGVLNPKYPGGTEQQRALLEAEGHKIVAKGAKLVVSDYKTRLAELV